jgi:hypothetical protein
MSQSLQQILEELQEARRSVACSLDAHSRVERRYARWVRERWASLRRADRIRVLAGLVEPGSSVKVGELASRIESIVARPLPRWHFRKYFYSDPEWGRWFARAPGGRGKWLRRQEVTMPEP